jgi:hypothetical protein
MRAFLARLALFDGFLGDLLRGGSWMSFCVLMSRPSVETALLFNGSSVTMLCFWSCSNDERECMLTSSSVTLAATTSDFTSS